jgi:hypothetical protein
MWIVLTRAPLPDAAYWPGRRLLAVADALAWPAAWIALAAYLPQPAGILAPAIMALAVIGGLVRARGAAWQNHRYRFTTWRWGRFLLALAVVGLVLQLASGLMSP